MNPTVRAAWLRALRSGDYRQGRHRLARLRADGGVEYCCLGVLCELARLAGVPLRVDDPERGPDDWSNRRYDGRDSLLPDAVVRWADLKDVTRDGDVLLAVAGVATSLSYLNDAGWSLAQVADALEEALP